MDDYIDRYWFKNCDKDKNRIQINDYVTQLLNDIVRKGHKKKLTNVKSIQEHNLIILSLDIEMRPKAY